MLDLRLIRERTEWVKSELAKVGSSPEEVDAVLAADAQRRELLKKVETLRARRSEISRLIPRLAPAEQELRKAEVRDIGTQLATLEAELAEAERTLEARLLLLPNLPDPTVPVGRDERDNQVVRTCGQIPSYSFVPKPHWELGPELGIIDFERGVKISGSRFYVLQGWGARLQRALIAWMLDVHVREHGYQEIYPPYLVKRECLVGAGQLPRFADNIYHDTEDDLWLIGTAEIPLTNLHRDEILDATQLPISYVAYTACFRREKMSAGRDVRGIKRVHQFDKVEMYKITTPETSAEALERIVADAEDIARRLGLTYRVVLICTGDLGVVAAKKYDIEVWAPGCQEWLEVSSCSNCTDYQARRANIRFRRGAGHKPELVHTLNGSGLALPRVMIAILESYQRPDGGVTVPDVLRPYIGTDYIPPASRN
ncbi:MAG: serine--tRNA ligase [Candidatus Binatia bacterium]|nr:MAG: serine--tRNA ligase [Candidatus Binatia bacterium]